MVNYRCDRCGGERRNRPRVTVPIKDGRMVDSIGWITLCSPTGYRMTLDLCEKCMDEFVAFMKTDGENS